MNKNQLKSEILEYIKAHAGTSFVEIERVFEENNFDYKGDGAYTSGQHPNVVFWVGWNQEAFDVIAELKKMDILRWIFVSQLFIWLMVKVWICLL
ncbi:hypothetical protein IS189_0946 [Staphylococcus aureus subsp. aureus IS-189]|nr:hypothetical protein IS189_0946 [Staphylococcus aureus subsp. aureus IS-189]